MTNNSNCGLPIGVYQINIGESLLSKDNNKTFHSIKYDFRPASISAGGAETFLQFSQNNYANVAIENESNNSLILYKGSDNKISNNKECMMLLDPNTNKLTIEKLSSQIRVKYLRNPADQIVQIIREKIQNKKGMKKEKTSEICRSEEREKSTPIRNPSTFVKLKEVKTSKMEDETTTEELLQGLDIDSPKNVNEDVVKNEEKPSMKGAVNISDFEDSSDGEFDDFLDKAVKTKENTTQDVVSGTEKSSNSNNTSNTKVNSEKPNDDLLDFFDNIDDFSNKSFPKSPKKPSPEVVKKVIPKETKPDPFNQNIFGSLDDSSDEDPIIEKNDKPKTVENKNNGQNKKMVGPGGRMWHDDLDLSEDEDEDSDDD